MQNCRFFTCSDILPWFSKKMTKKITAYKIVSSLSALSWKLLILWGFCGDSNWWFSDSEVFQKLELVVITKIKYAPNTGLNMWCLLNQEIRCWQPFMHMTSSNHPCINKLAFIKVCFQISLISYPDIHLLMKNLISETGWKPNLYALWVCNEFPYANSRFLL